MGSRDTFVTSFIYDRDALLVVEKVLKAYSDKVYRLPYENEPEYLAGVLRNVTVHASYPDVLAACDTALKAAGYSLSFNLAIVSDDKSGDVCSREAEYGIHYEVHGPSRGAF